MFDYYFWPTPNGIKILTALEELAADPKLQPQVKYNIIPVNITAGDQHKSDFIRISPNGKMPAIVDHNPDFPQKQFAMFESGAILLYLATKYQCLLSRQPADYWQTLVWLNWQVAGLGPMVGQSHHFHIYASEDLPYAKQRYRNEVLRLYQVLNDHIQRTASGYISSDYSIADIACYPLIAVFDKQQLSSLADYPALATWLEQIKQRPAVQAAMKIADKYRQPMVIDDAARRNLFTAR